VDPVVLLPAFFVFTGMRTRIDVATLGKFSGTLVAACLTSMGWRHAPALGTLMNTRGLVRLIVLNTGLGLKVLAGALFNDGGHGAGDHDGDVPGGVGAEAADGR
jgi:Kef-type K+ transport system membrane component KefB